MCPFRVKACERRPSCGGVLRSWPGQVITEAVSRDSALWAGSRSQVPRGFEGAEKQWVSGRACGGGVRGVGSMGFFVAAAHLNARHSPCRPVWQR